MPHVDAFEDDAEAVLADLRKGEFDYVEVASRVTEARFFRYLLDEGGLADLARSYPTPRRKEEVPLWLYLASQLTLRLHGQQAYATFPYVLHCGGLRDALGPRQVKLTEEEAGARRMRCEGYNDKNHYDRTTPCDQDFLRKLARDTPAADLVHWLNHHVARHLAARGAFDAQGVFLVDGSYLFVPDNPRYEGSSLLRFDEHNHPVSRKEYDALAAQDKERTRLRRCYRAVFLLHLGEQASSYPFGGLTVMAGSASESPWLGRLVDGFVAAAGRDVVKTVIFDRGFLDGGTISHLKTDLGIDSLFPLKKGMLDLEDARVLSKVDGRPWETWRPPPRPPPSVPPERPEAIRQRERARQATIALRDKDHPPPRVLESVELKAVRDLGGLWDGLTVPIQVVLMRERYSDGTVQEWSLASTNQQLEALQVRQLYAKRTAVEERHRQLKCFWDLTKFRSRSLSLVTAQVVFVVLAYTLLQVYLAKLERGELNEKTRDRLLGELSYEDDKVVLYSKNRVAYLTPLQHQEALLSLSEGARRRVLARTRELREHLPPGIEPPRRPGV